MTDKDIFGLDPSRSDNDINMDLHKNHFWSSNCKECALTEDELIIVKKMAKHMNEVFSFDVRPRMQWIVGHNKD